jgi:predicted PurR-regulated permease PerM
VDATVDGNPPQSRGTDWQRALFLPLTILAWMAVVIVALWLMSHLIKTIVTLILAAVVAFALTPVVTFLNRYMPRGIAIAVAYLLGFAILFTMLSLLVLTAAAQITSLVHQIPYYDQQIHQHQPQILRFLKPLGITAAKFREWQSHSTSYLQSTGTAVASQSVSIATGVLGAVIDIILVLILSVYLTANGQRISTRLARETPTGQRGHMDLLIGTVTQVVGGYIRGQLALAALIGFLVGFGMYILHVPYAVLLGLLAFFMEFIPVLGVLISGAICVIIALFQGVITAVLVLAYFVFVHIIEGDIVGPRIMGHAVGIHPATALLALVAGTELFGIWGALFAAPLAGFLQAIGTAAWREYRGQAPRAVVNVVKREVKESMEGGARPVPRPESAE